ncbi:MAG: hypothetical protein A2268_14830 [Candidatus Raymondbacteria bacterium RifOxyA12_full_50_37]|uniref:HTH cro/C1-type domain-containing protein n=1 Tax=Candidatus Raymondbacteria bacterium RIFOXYD12_FULL_49_13 TaxID=1817890 RepID=A0A1F7F2H1_UNCRA|nr:MAG: hypothetical protein A2268_14830 [Candidatus Raymondbacteria bacterium RifOxyA12_full_50_37]OGJ87838.1 MAG: hypothetical protein A2350_12775 [Candidatus Raymondbacteria bacterium RifOxyB12_full_50_8]OGJ88692.1 MAG: hypothetical protein A2248_20765 [Candidatus Raymondbacteria bacterium RIFOXYA2_FULL_49_16]OGK00864.1 MAG: hypothetical protein A2519_08020 [Candidatus Raymondbacteria bacterium RIFOXYD12_FULL_49_13]OGP41729.1 MAG: hypothetical protein A2324_07855 [Candidatus Raymondbacteria 
MEITSIAFNIRKLRQRKSFTVEALAKKAGVTKGFISQVENFRTVPSLPLLYKIAQALDVEPATLLAQDKETRTYVITRKDHGPVIEREFPESGFVYKALANEKNGKIMEPFTIEMPPHSTRKNVTTTGDEFFYMLEGKVDFFLGRDKVSLQAGDSLYFDGTVPHHPENNASKKALAIIIYAIKQG